MKTRPAKGFWKVAFVLVGVGIIGAVALSQRHPAGPELVAKTRQELRRHGFKTDLDQFNFSTSAELRAREAALTVLESSPSGAMPGQWPDLMERAGDQSAVVVWSQPLLKWPGVTQPGTGDQVTWDQLEGMLGERKRELDAACTAASSGPIHFNLEASHGGSMVLRHLPALRNLQHAFAARAMLALHQGHREAAWTNLIAATRLVTAWETEPTEVSELVRFALTSSAFDAVWQTLQTNAWSDQELAQLQVEWEVVDFLKSLPETAAFERACHTGAYEEERKNPQANLPLSPSAVLQSAWRNPWAAWSDLRYRWSRLGYLRGGQYEEQRDLLLFDEQREIELRNATRSLSWAQMRQLPGVTNRPVFQTQYPSRVQMLMRTRQIGLAFQRGSQGLLGQAAEAEAHRRILIAALALERYHTRRGAYPTTLADLAPDFLKTEPLDFMDGKPLRYQLNTDGHYLLYSVGLDRADDGGKMPGNERLGAPGLPAARLAGTPAGDIVWPFPAPMTVVSALRRHQSAGYEEKATKARLSEAQAQWEHTARHQADAEKLLAAPALNPPDIDYLGRPLSEWLRNPSIAGTNVLSLRDMFTLKPVSAGNEPEWVTFELAVSYEALTKLGEMYLLIDTNNDDSDEGCVVQKMECRQADNGDCLLAWNTIYESPGSHALRAGLRPFRPLPGADSIVGSPLPFVVSNLCQFSDNSAQFDPRLGAAFLLKLPETNGQFVVKCQTPDGLTLKTMTGATSNGIINLRWDLEDEHGQRFTGDAFDTLWTITLPGSGRAQTLRGP
jgi:hypothetical protein